MHSPSLWTTSVNSSVGTHRRWSSDQAMPTSRRSVTRHPRLREQSPQRAVGDDETPVLALSGQEPEPDRPEDDGLADAEHPSGLADGVNRRQRSTHRNKPFKD